MAPVEPAVAVEPAVPVEPAVLVEPAVPVEPAVLVEPAERAALAVRAGLVAQAERRQLAGPNSRRRRARRSSTSVPAATTRTPARWRCPSARWLRLITQCATDTPTGCFSSVAALGHSRTR